jgi:mRNA interferase RelE/StbE
VILDFKKSATKELEKLPRDAQLQIAGWVRKLAENPFACDVKKLRGRTGYRLRCGDYRVLFEIDGAVITIFSNPAPSRSVSVRLLHLF